MKKKQSLASNYYYNLIYQIVTIIMPLITTPYLSRVLGAENIGIFGYTFSIVTYFILFGSLGVAMYGQREIAYVQDDRKKRSKTFLEVNIIKFFAYILSLTTFYFFFCSSGELNIYYKILIFEMLANVIDVTWFFQGMEDFKKPVIRNLIVKVMGLVCIFLLVKNSQDLWIYFLIYVLANFFGNFVLWFYIPNYIDFNFKTLNFKHHLKPILMLFLPQIAIQIYSVLDKTMIGILTNSMEEVGYYDQAQKVIRAVLLIVTALSAVMSSRIANSYAEKKFKQIKQYLLQSINMVWLISIPCIFGIIAISNKLVPWYFGSGYDEVINLMNFTSFILLAIGLNNVIGIQYLIQTKKQNLFTLSVIIGAITNVIFNFIFIKAFGTVGAVCSSVLAEFIILIIEIFYAREIINFGEILKPSIKYIFSGLIMFIGVSYVTKNLSIGIFNTFIEICIGAIIYILMLFVLKDKFCIALFNQNISILKNVLFRKRKR